MAKPRLLAAFLAAALGACGGPDAQNPPPEAPSIGDPEAYFGLAPCTCLEYRPADGGALRLGIAVEAVTDIYTPGTALHAVRYRLNGQQRRVDFFRPTDPELLLVRVNVGQADNDEYWHLDPPLPLLVGPVEEQSTVEATTTATPERFAQPAGDPVTVSLRIDYAPQPVEAATDGGAPRTLEARRILLSGDVPWRDQVRWFVPELGFAKVELDVGGSGRRTWVLANVRRLEGGCPWRPGDAIPTDQICGLD